MIKREFTIYKIENQQNGRVYVGCTECGERRIKQHFYALRSGKHISKIMQADFDNGDPFRVASVYAFTATVTGKDIDSNQAFCVMSAAHELESYFIYKFDASKSGYNNKNYQTYSGIPQEMPNPLHSIIKEFRYWKISKSKLKEFCNLYPTKDKPEKVYKPIDLYFSKANGINKTA